MCLQTVSVFSKQRFVLQRALNYPNLTVSAALADLV